AERVAGEARFGKQELDEVTVRRYEQYSEALARERAFQRPWMVPITVGAGRRTIEIDADDGVRPVSAEGLAGLKPVWDNGVVSYGTQTHPADGTAGMIVTGVAQAREVEVG